ncbi:MAG: 1,4-alpha-glucan branching enzyme, partial [Gammaproteobacteria bacterium]|nr:1,4-alpha-glucan branching enzyme [Gammaproteobacteria bacterium]
MSLNNTTFTDKITTALKALQDDLDKIALARHHQPFNVLGNQTAYHSDFLIFYSPDARQLSVSKKNIPAKRLANSDFFICTEQLDQIGEHYLLTRTDNDGNVTSYYDPYSFSAQIGNLDLHLFGEGKHLYIYRILGAHPKTVDGIDGVLFATWAPNAARVSVIGDFNSWDGR